MSYRVGPFSRVTHRNDFYESLRWFRSVPSKSLVCEFDLMRSKGGVNLAAHTYIGRDSDVCERASNKCRGRFVDQVQVEAQHLVNLYERESTFRSLANKLNTLRRGWNAFRGGDLKGLAKSLGKKAAREFRRKDWRKHSRNAGAAWLDFHFGWEPLMGDIYSTVLALKAPPLLETKVRATASGTQVDRGTSLTPWGVWRTEYTFQCRWLMQAYVSVSNPNHHLANQMGLVNPLTVAWEIVPFSFLVDWFIPIGSYLGSFSDFYGLTLRDAFTTNSRHAISAWNHSPFPPADDPVWSLNGEAWMVQRRLGIAAPVVAWQPPQRLSLARAATAISLLVAGFKSNGNKPMNFRGH